MSKVKSIGKTEVKSANPNKLSGRMGKLFGKLLAEQKNEKKCPPPTK